MVKAQKEHSFPFSWNEIISAHFFKHYSPLSTVRDVIILNRQIDWKTRQLTTARILVVNLRVPLMITKLFPTLSQHGYFLERSVIDAKKGVMNYSYENISWMKYAKVREFGKYEDVSRGSEEKCQFSREGEMITHAHVPFKKKIESWILGNYNRSCRKSYRLLESTVTLLQNLFS